MSCKTINIDLANVPPVPLQIGVAGENAFRTITFDASKWGAGYPDATYTVVYRRSDGYLYPVLVNASADAIVWNPTATDTAVSGNGQLEVRLLDGETIGKTIIMQTYVAPSLTGDESTPPQPAPDWVNDVAADADRAEAAVSHYPKIVNGVWYVWSVQDEDYVSTGIEAQGEDGHSPTVTVTEIDGGHRVAITDADGAHTFDVMDGEDGEGGGTAADAVLYTAQTLTDAQQAQARENIGAGTYSKPSGGIPASDLASDVISEDVFVAVRGTTTEAEIREAQSAGKVVICIYQNRVYYLSDISDNASEIVFRTTPNQLGNTYALVVNGSRWIGLTTNLARKSDIPTVPITSISVDGIDQHPIGGNVNISLPDVPTDYVNTIDFEERTGSMNLVLSYSNGVVAIEQSGTPLDRLIPAILNNCNHWFLLPTAYITGIPSNTDMMRFWMTGANLNTSAPTVSLTSEYGGKVYHAVLSPVSEYRMEGQLQVLDYQTAQDVQTAISNIPDELPTVSSTDNGKFLRVVSGAWAAQTVPSAESNSFGGGS